MREALRDNFEQLRFKYNDELETYKDKMVNYTKDSLKLLRIISIIFIVVVVITSGILIFNSGRGKTVIWKQGEMTTINIEKPEEKKDNVVDAEAIRRENVKKKIEAFESMTIKPEIMDNQKVSEIIYIIENFKYVKLKSVPKLKDNFFVIEDSKIDEKKIKVSVRIKGKWYDLEDNKFTLKK